MMVKSTIRIGVFIFFILSLTCGAAFSESVIISANSFSKVQQLISKDKQPHHLLLAMDDDDTLIMMPCPNSSHCQYLGGPAWFAWQAKLPKNSPDRAWKTFPQLLKISNLLFTVSNAVLVDPLIPKTLKTADQRGASLMVITDRGYQMTGATEQQFTRTHILKLLDKNAVKTASDHISFPGFYFPKKWSSETPRRIAYLHGVLYVSGQNKGEMIKQLLEKTHQTKNIREIIFIDDTLKNVEDVAHAYQNDPAVRAVCIHFTRLKAHKAALTQGKQAKQFQVAATVEWKNIKTALENNLPGTSF